MSLALFSLASLPPTGGLVGKIFLAAAGVGSSLWLLLSALVIGSVIGVFYYLRIVITILRQPMEGARRWIAPGAGITANATLAALGIALLVTGVFPSPLINLIESLSIAFR